MSFKSITPFSTIFQLYSMIDWSIGV